jgi:hypothetical protein
MDNSEKTANIGSTRYKTNKQKTRYGLLLVPAYDKVSEYSGIPTSVFLLL